MKKYQYLESSAKLSQLEARLNKNDYLSKSSLPSAADAKVFLFFQQLRKIPNRSTHPNLYHWYILMKQFSLRTIEIWEQQEDKLTDDDKLIYDYVRLESSPSAKENCLSNIRRVKRFNSLRDPSESPDTFLSHGTSSKKLKILPTQDTNLILRKQSMSNGCSFKLISNEDRLVSSADLSILPRSPPLLPALEIQYVMEIQLKSQKTPIKSIKKRLQEEKLQLLSFDSEEGTIRVAFKADVTEYQKLKDRISQWEQISNLQFRKLKKGLLRAFSKSQNLISNPEIADILN